MTKENIEPKNFVFFLGGNDLEMSQIKHHLANAGCEIINKGLSWGAHASAYNEEIAAAGAAGKTCVLIELDNESHDETAYSPVKHPVALPQGSIEIDHHNKAAGRPQSIIQILSLLGVEPSRRDWLMAINDEGFIPGMLRYGASMEEIQQIRAEDRKIQGITPEQEQQAEKAVANREEKNGLIIVRCPHSKSAAVADRVAVFQDPSQQNLLILSEDGEVNFYGNKMQVLALVDKFPGGWSGGLSTETNCFWGGHPDHDEVESFIKTL